MNRIVAETCFVELASEMPFICASTCPCGTSRRADLISLFCRYIASFKITAIEQVLPMEVVVANATNIITA